MKNNKTAVVLSLLLLAVFGLVGFGLLNENEESLQGRFGRGNAAVQKPNINVPEDEYVIDESDYVDGAVLLADLVDGGELTAEERAGLLLMREEEKLARDVYTALYAAWNIPVFSTIAASEQTHMAAVGQLIERYGLTDPASADISGVFTNPDLQKLYNDLVAAGLVSKSEAFRVGALIEDLDIADLERLLTQTAKSDIALVYKNLQKGSRNHLRAFVKQLDRVGGTYEPVYISESEYINIINSAQDRGGKR